jgi:hypothetical protein
MNKLIDFVLAAVAVLGVPGVLIWAFIIYTDMPDVVYSYSTKQCVKVIYADGSEGSCDNLPKRFHHVWGK